jgi:hypothetical protein
MLHNFAMIFQVFFRCFFASVSDICFKCFSCLLCMLQLLYLDVSKVDRVLHMRYAWEVADGAGQLTPFHSESHCIPLFSRLNIG